MGEPRIGPPRCKRCGGLIYDYITCEHCGPGLSERPMPEEPHVEHLRRLIVEQYATHPTGCGGSFGEILCHEIHTRGLTFDWLARKWGVSLAMLGELIADHCRRLEAGPRVDHGYDRP